MRWLGRAAILTALLVLLWWLVPLLRDSWPQRQVAEATNPLTERTPVFVLNQGQWTEFALPPQTGLVRVSSRLASSDAESLEDLRYAIEFEFANASDTSRRRYHLRSRLPRAEELQYRRGVDPDTPLTRQRNFYVDPTEFGSDLLRLRVAAAEGDAQPQWLAVEVAAQVNRGGEQSRLLWQRLRSSVRRELSRASIAPLSLLDREELDKLLRKGWQALGPEGVAGRDYTREVVYAQPRVELTPEVIPPGVPLAPHQQLSLTLPEATPLRLTASSAQPGELTLVDTGSGTSRSVALVGSILSWPGQSESMLFGPGVVTLSTTVDATVQLSNRRSGEPIEFVFGYSPHYLADASGSLRYSLAEPGGSVRVDLRGLDSVELGRSDLTQSVQYRWRDADEAVIATGQLAFVADPDPLTRLQTWRSPDRLTMRSRYFLRAPQRARAIDFVATTPALLAVANRPLRLAWRRASAELAVSQPGAVAGAAWFSLYPNNDEQLYADRRRLQLRTQPRPPAPPTVTDDPRYQWQPLVTSRPHRQQLLVAPSELSQAGPTAFVGLRNGANEVHFEQPVAPQLIYLRDQATPIDLTVRWTGGEVRRRVAGREGQIDLPRLDAGAQRLSLEVADGSWWINHAAPSVGQAGMRQRRVYELAAQPLRLEILKRGNGREVINIEAYLGQAGANPALNLSAALPVRASQHREYTVEQRQLQLADLDQTGRPGRVLFRDGERVGSAQRGLFVLGGDVPPGRYQLTLDWVGVSRGYVIAYQLPRGAEIMSRFLSEELGQ